ncbi:MAG: PKD domain-containing protein, partial [Paracoccaceae bacterium]
MTLTDTTRGNRAVTLQSADADTPARFSGVAINGAANVTLDGITFEYRFQQSDPSWDMPFTIQASHNLTIRNSIFDGDLAHGVSPIDDGYGTGIGLTIDKSSAVTLTGNQFFNFLRGLVVSDSEHVTIWGNEISAIRSDGMDFASVQSVLIANNQLHDFKASRMSDDHADMIQFWTAGTSRPTKDVVIRDNVLNSGNGGWTQSIFMGNELVRQGLAGPEMFYRNITISGNVIINSHLHGITVGEADGLAIAHNTLIHNRRTDGDTNNPGLWTPRINVAETSQNVTIQGNATVAISGPEKRPDWKVAGNVLIQDTEPAAPGYYDDVFVAALTGNPQNLAAFTYRPGGVVDGVRVGAARLIAPMPPDHVAPQIQTTRDIHYVNRFTFDAGQSTGPDGLEDARYFWSFGDGATAESQRATHTFATAGDFHVTLTVRPASGTQAVADDTLSVPSAYRLHFDPATGQLFVSKGDGEVPLPDVPLIKPPDDASLALPLGMGHPAIVIPHDQLEGLFNAQDFELLLRLKVAKTDNPAGEILRLHNNMLLTWQPSTGLGFRLETAKVEPVTIWTGPLPFNTDVWHNIRITYDATTGMLGLEVDGTLRARGKSAGPLKPDENQDLSLGNPFGQKSFDGFLGGMDL